jgi:Leucine-rich repeat (LRR) protein
MSDLDILKLKNTKLESLPESFMNLKWLSGLDLSGNHFIVFPEVLKKLNLYKLDISGNPIKELPKKLRNIKLMGDGKYI